MPLLKEILESQTGWELKNCFFMEVRLDVDGYIPIVLKHKPENVKSRLIVVTTDKEQMKKLWESLEKRHVRVDEGKCMVNVEKKLVIPLNTRKGNDASSDNWYLVLDTAQELANHVEFDYADNETVTISFRDDSTAVFPE